MGKPTKMLRDEGQGGAKGQGTKLSKDFGEAPLLKVSSGWKIGVVTSRFNPDITKRLRAGAENRFLELGGRKEQLFEVNVPGALEIPLASRWLFNSGCDGVLTLGAVIRGETSHYDIVCEGYLRGCLRVQEEVVKPLSFGVLTVENRQQALSRSGGERGHKGETAIEVLLEMLILKGEIVG